MVWWDLDSISWIIAGPGPERDVEVELYGYVLFYHQLSPPIKVYGVQHGV
jgi:hypothetical protein